jgi:hypothetical protein
MKYYVEETARELRETFERHILTWPQVTTRTMFGCPAYLADRRLFAFLVTEGIVITQLHTPDREALGKIYTTEPFQVRERTIERWITVFIPEPEAYARVMPYVKKSHQIALEVLK